MSLKTLFALALAASLSMATGLRAEDAEESASSESASTVEPIDKPGSLQAGKDLMSEEKWAEAAAYFRGIGVQSSKKREPWRLNNLSLCEFRQGNFKEAAEAAKAGLEVDDSNAILWNNYGSALANIPDRPAAIKVYKEGISKVASDKAAKLKANLAYLEALEAGSSESSDEGEDMADTSSDEEAEKE